MAESAVSPVFPGAGCTSRRARQEGRAARGKSGMGDRPQLDSLLEALGRGDRAAHDAVFALAYDELKRIARSHIRRVGGMVTINPSTLVHEAWIRLAQGGDRALHS